MNRTRTIVTALFVAGLLGAVSPAFSETTALAEDTGAPTPLEQQMGQQQLAHAQRAFGRYLEFWRMPDTGAHSAETLFTPNAVSHMPYADPSAQTLHGPDAIVRQLRERAGAATDWTYSNVAYFATPDPRVFFVSLRATGLDRESRQVQQHTFMYRVTLAGDQIEDLLVLWDADAADARVARTQTRKMKTHAN